MLCLAIRQSSEASALSDRAQLCAVLQKSCKKFTNTN